MNYGFVIRNDQCIGCHACSTACKSENEVPLGVNRTWVKSVETGAYPNVQRQFQVTRCNHCANPPCVRICPVTAMYQREDGIVEFDQDVCIGCKACLQACPYDAIYIDPESGTAAKCHYCAHRVDLGLEPACVVVCPEHAILAGDLDDPNTEISRVLASHQVTVRRPEQGTAPKLFYVDGAAANLHPTAVERTPATFAWADVLPLEGETPTGDGSTDRATPPAPKRHAASGAALRPAQHQGLPEAGPIMIGDGRMAEQMVQVVYNAQHRVPWHWPVPAYLVTKAIGAGLFLLLALSHLFGLIPAHGPTFVVSGLVTLVFMMLTTALLVFDLEKPGRFFSILTRPQWKSWLTRGAFLLVGFSLLAGVWWLLEVGAWMGWWGTSVAAQVRPWMLWVGAPLATGAAVYTAFLFGQAEGRDLWQSTLLPVHLLVQSLLAGGAALMIMDFFMEMPLAVAHVGPAVFVVMLVLDLLMMLMGEFGMPHASDAAARAAHAIRAGKYRHHFWLWSVVVGHVLPLALLFVGAPLAWAGAALAALVGLYFYEYAFVMAPQEIPNS